MLWANFVTDFYEQSYEFKGKRKWELYEFGIFKKCRCSHQYIYLSFMVITNEYNFKNNVFTNSFLLQCVFYDICIFWYFFPNLITFHPKLLMVSLYLAKLFLLICTDFQFADFVLILDFSPN